MNVSGAFSTKIKASDVLGLPLKKEIAIGNTLDLALVRIIKQLRLEVWRSTDEVDLDKLIG